jgi:outer membrane protein assembly factor BamB
MNGYRQMEQHPLVMAFGGLIRAFDPVTGQVVWNVEPGGYHWWKPSGVITALEVTAEFVFAAGAGNLLCLSYPTGNLYWQVSTPSPVATMVVDESRIYLASHRDVSCCSRDDGRQLWYLKTAAPLKRFFTQFRPTTQSVPEIVVDSECIYLAHQGALYCIDCANGRQRWSAKTDLRVPTQMTVRPDRIYLAGRGKLKCLDRHNGRQLWTTAFPDRGIVVGPLVVGFSPLRWSISPLVTGTPAPDRRYQPRT